MNFFKKMNTKLGKIVLLYIVAIVVVIIIYVNENNSIYKENTVQAELQINNIKTSILDQMQILDELYLKLVEASMNTLIRNGNDLGTPALGAGTSFEGGTVPKLLFGNTDMTGNYSLVDMVTEDMGGTATLFVWNSNEFVRVSTNVKKDDGSRAVGTVLTKNGVVEQGILAGKAYYGIVDILGKPYFTGYEPMYGSGGKIVGIWYVGYPLEQMNGLAECISGKKIFENDFFLIMDKADNIIAKSNNDTDETLSALLSEAQDNDNWDVSSSEFVPWGYKVVSAIKTMDINTLAQKNSLMLLLDIGIIFVLFSLFIFYFVFSSDRTNKKIMNMAQKLALSATAVSSASINLSDSSRALSEGSVEQAAAIEETSATMEQTAAMVEQNAENTRIANSLSKEASQAAATGSEKMNGMKYSMDELKKSSADISKIIKVIDDIAFQTNMLALNAAVEAARAGEAGQGFSVVAEEVRNLAQKSAQAAKNTAEIIEKNIQLSEQGAVISSDVANSLAEIMEKTKSVNRLMDEISAASSEQARGTAQVKESISQMESVVQTNAASSEESAASAEELRVQSKALEEIISELNILVKGSQKNNESEVSQIESSADIKYLTQ